MCLRAGVTYRNYVALFTNAHPFRRWNSRGIIRDGRESKSGTVMDQAWFCGQVAEQNRVAQVGEKVKQLRVGCSDVNQAAFKVISRC